MRSLGKRANNHAYRELRLRAPFETPQTRSYALDRRRRFRGAVRAVDAASSER